MPRPRMVGPPSPLHAAITRTVAIIKNHALHHRFDIERRIQEASFEIVKERQMEFDTETDPDTLYELFGDDAASFSEGPVWVYVLERRRAVEVWNTLMGPKDPAVGREDMPNSLRALYGISSRQNGVMGSPDAELAEIQIASLFISSPPFPPTELPSDDHDGSYDSLDAALRLKLMSDTTSNGTRSSLGGGRVSTTSSGNLNANGKPLFRARPIPATMLTPDIVPRTTRAAALRAGQVVEKKDTVPRKPLTKEQLKQTFLNVPGHKRAEVIAVASTAPPTIVPRMSKAASLRIGQIPSPSPVRRSATEESKKKTFEGVPGHKRRGSISVTSTKAPAVPPKLNKSAVLRVSQKEATPPSSFRRTFGASNGFQTPSRPGSSMAATRRSSSVMSVRPSPTLNGAHATRSKDDTDTPAPNPELAQKTTTPMRRRSSITSPPSITPRTNRSAELRAAKKEMDAAAAAAKNAPRKSTTRPSASKAPPTSFRPPAVTS